MFPETLEQLDFTELDPKFHRERHRVMYGSANEIVRYDVEGYFPSSYSEIIGSYEGDVSYRYVRSVYYIL